MELYLDSAQLDDVQAASELFPLAGITTTPTFLHRQGVTDVDQALVDLSEPVHTIQVEALGETAETIIEEAHRLSHLPFRAKVVYKVPVSNQGLKACWKLSGMGYDVNLHLVYTLNQAFMAMNAGAAYVCPLVGRLQDQGHDAMTLISQCQELKQRYGFQTKIMVSSVRHPEHVRQALVRGADSITVPYSVLKSLSLNSLTDVGARQFEVHTRLMTLKVQDIIRPVNPTCQLTDTVQDALVAMTDSRLGAVSVLDASGQLAGCFTDGDLRRLLNQDGKAALDSRMVDLELKSPLTVEAEAPLVEVEPLFRTHQVDNYIVVNSQGAPIGILDIQDFVKQGLLAE